MAEKFRVAIIGSGPAGLGAAARAARKGMSHILLERADHLADTIYSFQKRKLVMAQPPILPLRSDAEFDEGSREEVLAKFKQATDGAGVNIQFKSEVTAIEGTKGAFTLTLINGTKIEAETVVLAIGASSLHKLTVPGANWARVQYQLDDPDEYRDERIVIIGGGDAGIENALALMANNDVSIVVNQMEYAPNAAPANVAAIKAAVKSQAIQAYMGASIQDISPNLLNLNTPQGVVGVPCDRIIARIGASPDRRFMERCGITFPSPQARLPKLSETYETDVAGLYVVGALTGYPLIKQCLNQGYEVIEFIDGNMIPPADEPLIEDKIRKAGVKLSVSRLIDAIPEILPLFAKLTRVQVRGMLLPAELHLMKSGAVIFNRNDYTDSLYCILEGQVDIHINPQNDKEVVTLSKGDFFGEMGLIAGRRRTATTTARGNTFLLEVPRRTALGLISSVSEVKRVIDEVATLRQIQTYLAPKATREFLAPVLKEAEIVSLKKGDVLIEQGGTDDSLYLIRSGTVKVSRMDAGRELILSYVPAGKYVGEAALLTKQPRNATVTAAVATEAVRLAGESLRALLEQRPDVKAQVEGVLRKRAFDTVDKQQESLGGIPSREGIMVAGLGEASDVLLIDESLCVRCDNCETACAETHHGVSRLNREAGPTFANIHVPTSCRHCHHPHCMKDCPADAIHRAPTGEVFITDNCIGCGNCERGCPYGVIQMAATPPEKPGLLQWLLFGFGPGPGEDKSPEGLKKRTGSKHAVKCDLCKDQQGGPACVRACPTGAAVRVAPKEFLEMTGQ